MPSTSTRMGYVLLALVILGGPVGAVAQPATRPESSGAVTPPTTPVPPSHRQLLQGPAIAVGELIGDVPAVLGPEPPSIMAPCPS
jgi:hypothetical protein